MISRRSSRLAGGGLVFEDRRGGREELNNEVPSASDASSSEDEGSLPKSGSGKRSRSASAANKELARLKRAKDLEVEGQLSSTLFSDPNFLEQFKDENVIRREEESDTVPDTNELMPAWQVIWPLQTGVSVWELLILSLQPHKRTRTTKVLILTAILGKVGASENCVRIWKNHASAALIWSSACAGSLSVSMENRAGLMYRTYIVDALGSQMHIHPVDQSGRGG